MGKANDIDLIDLLTYLNRKRVWTIDTVLATVWGLT